MAHKHRSISAFINRRINQSKERLTKVNNGLVHIHFGVHKTATTYIQENLELIIDQGFHYTKLDDFRESLRESGYLNYLRSLDWSQKIVISDENMIGGNGTILTGALYPEFKAKANKFLTPFKNRNYVKVYISIRPMTSLLPSQYCEYLRRHPYFSYEEFTSKVHVEQLKWIDILHETIACNRDLSFYIFDFCKFAQSKDLFLSELSFGLKNKCDQSIERSRTSFTDKEISQLSNGEFTSNKDTKFDPHTEEEKNLSMLNFKNDLTMLAKIPNVTMLS